MSSHEHVVSTGRGGAGNIGHDPTVYADGGIIREGVAGETNRGHEYSTGRGGAGNMGTPKLGPSAPSQDVIPETALRSSEGYENYHTGRGGEGNVHRDKFGGHSHAPKAGEKKESLVDKAKHLLHMDGEKSPQLKPSDA